MSRPRRAARALAWCRAGAARSIRKSTPWAICYLRMTFAMLLIFTWLPHASAGDVELVKHAGEPARVLCLGDSYTIGESVPEADRWPVQLAKMLRQGGIDV